MARWIDTLSEGSTITGAEVFPGMIGRVGYQWTFARLAMIPQLGIVADYTATLADAAKHFYHPPTDTAARTITIPANAVVAFEVGQTLTFINDVGAGALTIVCNDTMWLAGSASTGNRTLAAGGAASAVKVASTRWIISGPGLT